MKTRRFVCHSRRCRTRDNVTANAVPFLRALGAQRSAVERSASSPFLSADRKFLSARWYAMSPLCPPFRRPCASNVIAISKHLGTLVEFQYPPTCLRRDASLSVHASNLFAYVCTVRASTGPVEIYAPWIPIFLDHRGYKTFVESFVARRHISAVGVSRTRCRTGPRTLAAKEKIEPAGISGGSRGSIKRPDSRKFVFARLSPRRFLSFAPRRDR